MLHPHKAYPTIMIPPRGRKVSPELLVVLQGNMVRAMALMGYRPDAISEHVIKRSKLLRGMDETEAAYHLLNELPLSAFHCT